MDRLTREREPGIIFTWPASNASQPCFLIYASLSIPVGELFCLPPPSICVLQGEGEREERGERLQSRQRSKRARHALYWRKCAPPTSSLLYDGWIGCFCRRPRKNTWLQYSMSGRSGIGIAIAQDRKGFLQVQQ